MNLIGAMKRARQENTLINFDPSFAPSTREKKGAWGGLKEKEGISTGAGTAKTKTSNSGSLHDFWVPPSVALSSRDMATQLELLDGQMTVVGSDEGGGGYRMVRATHGVHDGAYFWEAQILPTTTVSEEGEAPHVRLGWSTRMGELQAPVGYDKHSYGYRDMAGSKVNNSIRLDHYGEAFGPGDIIGCYLRLCQADSSKNEIRFFKNGKDQGVAYKEIPSGIFFPAVSLFKAAKVRVNFGPSFILPYDLYGANAVSEVQPMSPEDRKVHEQRIADIRASITVSE